MLGFRFVQQGNHGTREKLLYILKASLRAAGVITRPITT
jgi:hypothetical protein